MTAAVVDEQPKPVKAAVPTPVEAPEPAKTPAPVIVEEHHPGSAVAATDPAPVPVAPRSNVPKQKLNQALQLLDRHSATAIGGSMLHEVRTLIFEVYNLI